MFFDGRTVCRQGSVACVRPAGGVGLVARKRAPTPSGWLVEVRLRGRSLAPLRALLRHGESLCFLMAVQSVGKALWLACDLLAALAWSPASGLLRRAAGWSRSACEGDPWLLCALCFAAVNLYVFSWPYSLSARLCGLRATCWRRWPGRPQAGSYAERLAGRGPLAREILGSSAHAASPR
jgi:hypothetical protein